MTDILDESEGAPPSLLRPLISCLKKGNKVLSFPWYPFAPYHHFLINHCGC